MNDEVPIGTQSVALNAEYGARLANSQLDKLLMLLLKKQIITPFEANQIRRAQPK